MGLRRFVIYLLLGDFIRRPNPHRLMSKTHNCSNQPPMSAWIEVTQEDGKRQRMKTQKTAPPKSATIRPVREEVVDESVNERPSINKLPKDRFQIPSADFGSCEIGKLFRSRIAFVTVRRICRQDSKKWCKICLCCALLGDQLEGFAVGTSTERTNSLSAMELARKPKQHSGHMKKSHKRMLISLDENTASAE